MGQGTLFDVDGGAGAYGPRESLPHNGRPTSRAAALAAEPRAGTWRHRVLEHIRSCGAEGATRDEVIIALRMNPSTARPRIVELVEAGLIRDSGRVRLNGNGLRTEVLVATDSTTQEQPG